MEVKTLSNNSHVYVKIIKYIPGDLLAPFNDGSVRDLNSRAYKNIKKENEKNYEFLAKYIESGKLLEVSSIEFANRSGSKIDYMQTHRISVFNKENHRLYYFNIGDETDNFKWNGQDLYSVKFYIDQLGDN